MTKEVMVTLSGLQLGDSGEDTVETVHIGEYYEKNGVHYLFFDELLEGHKTPIRNMLKLRNEKLEMTASYELMVNGAHCSDCDIKVTVEPRHSYRLCKETEEAPGNIDTKDAQ